MNTDPDRKILEAAALCSIADARAALEAESHRDEASKRLSESAALSLEISMKSAEFHLKLGNVLRLKGEVEILHLRLSTYQGR